MPGQDFPPGTFMEFVPPMEKMDRIEASIDLPEREMEIVDHMDGAGETNESANKSDWNDEYDDRSDDDNNFAEDAADGILGAIAIDVEIPDPSDLFLPKWI